MRYLAFSVCSLDQGNWRRIPIELVYALLKLSFALRLGPHSCIHASVFTRSPLRFVGVVFIRSKSSGAFIKPTLGHIT